MSALLGRMFSIVKVDTQVLISLVPQGRAGCLTLEELQLELTRIVTSPPQPVVTLSLTMGGSMRDCPSETWARFCDVVKPAIPDLDGFEICLSTSDEVLAQLGLLLPSGLSRLTILCFTAPSITFHGICNNFPRLTHLHVKSYAKCFGKEPLRMLSDCVSNLPNLKNVNIVLGVEDQMHWTPLVGAIRKQTGLEYVHIATRSGIHDTIWPSENDLEAIQFGPRLNDAKNQYFTPPNKGEEVTVTLEQWVEAVVAVRDRVDCLDYFLSTLDPNLYAKAAVAALTN